VSAEAINPGSNVYRISDRKALGSTHPAQKPRPLGQLPVQKRRPDTGFSPGEFGPGGPDNAPLQVAFLRQMQQTHGNRAVQRLVQSTANLSPALNESPSQNMSAAAPDTLVQARHDNDLNHKIVSTAGTSIIFAKFGIMQRQEGAAAEAEEGPSEAEKAAALAAAKVAEQIAAQAKSKGKEEVVKSQVEKAAEKEVGQAAKEKAESAKAGIEAKTEKGEAGPTEAESGKKKKAEAEGKTAPAPAKAPRGGKSAGPMGKEGAAEPEDKASKSSEEDPAFQNVVGKIKSVGAKEQAHAPAESKANEAQDAAEAPASEVESI
jgi:hypothetical protein